MANINIDSIMAKVHKYAMSNDGRIRMKNRIQELRNKEVSSTDAGGRIITAKDMCEVADGLIRFLQESASAHKLPASVLDHFSSLTYFRPTEIKNGNERYLVSIYFADDLSRPSLQIVNGARKGQRTGDGIENVVSLFDTGYSASDVVYGVWDSHADEGIIRSREQRDSIGFMREAVDRFNVYYGKLYDVRAEITADPEFYLR